LYVLVSNSTGQNPWEAYSYSATQETPRFYGTRRFVTVFTRARSWCLSRVRWI